MVRRKKDVLDHLCGSMEFFMCGADDFSKFRSKATGTSATAAPKQAAEEESSPPAESNNAQEDSAAASGEEEAPAKKVSLVTPDDDDDVDVEKDRVSVSIRVESPRQPTYLELVSYCEKKGVYIKTIKPESKFYGTKVEEGMKIIRINGTSCPATVKETFEFIKAADEVLTLTAVVVESKQSMDDFMFSEIKLDDEEGKNLQEEEEKGENAPSPTRVTTDWFNKMNNGIKGIVGGKKQNEDESKEKKAEERKERIKNAKNTAVKSERDRIGLGFADQVLKDLGVIEQDGEDNDSLFTYEQDDTTYRSAPTVDDTTYKSGPVDDDDFTLSTTGGTTILDTTPIIAKIFKKTKKDNLGLHFVSFKKKRGIYVYRIHEESRFLSTKLEPGMKLLAINDQPCPATVAETLALVQNIEGNLSIKAKYPAPDDVEEPAEKNASKKEDLTGVQVTAAFGDNKEAEEKKEDVAEVTEKKDEEKKEDAKEEEKKEEAGESDGEETEMLVAKLENVTKSITDAVEDPKKEEVEKMDVTDEDPSEDQALPRFEA